EVAEPRSISGLPGRRRMGRRWDFARFYGCTSCERILVQQRRCAVRSRLFTLAAVCAVSMICARCGSVDASGTASGGADAGADGGTDAGTVGADAGSGGSADAGGGGAVDAGGGGGGGGSPDGGAG